MTLNALITKILQSRSGALWRGVSRKPTHDNFSAPMGRLRLFMASFPEDTPRARQTFFDGIYYQDLLSIRTGNASGRALMEAVDKLKP